MASHCVEFHKEYPSCLSFLYFFLNAILIQIVSLSSSYFLYPTPSIVFLSLPLIYVPFSKLLLHIYTCICTSMDINAIFSWISSTTIAETLYI